MTAVYKAISAITKAMGEHGISKGRKNAQQGYQFRGIEDVYKALNPLLSEHGLVILPRVVSRETESVASKNGGQLFYTRLMVEFDFVAAEDGSKHTACTVGEAMDSGDKSHNKAMSTAYKYAAFLTFCIPTEGLQEDTEQHTHEVMAEPKQVTSQPPSDLAQVTIQCREYCDALEVSPDAAKVAFSITNTKDIGQMRLLLAGLKNLMSKVNAGAKDYSKAEETLLNSRKGQ